MGVGGRIDRRLSAYAAPGEGAVAGVEAGRPLAVAEKGASARPQATRHGRAMRDVAQDADTGTVAEVGAAGSAQRGNSCHCGSRRVRVIMGGLRWSSRGQPARSPTSGGGGSGYAGGRVPRGPTSPGGGHRVNRAYPFRPQSQSKRVKNRLWRTRMLVNHPHLT